MFTWSVQVLVPCVQSELFAHRFLFDFVLAMCCAFGFHLHAFTCDIQLWYVGRLSIAQTALFPIWHHVLYFTLNFLVGDVTPWNDIWKNWNAHTMCTSWTPFICNALRWSCRSRLEAMPKGMNCSNWAHQKVNEMNKFCHDQNRAFVRDLKDYWKCYLFAEKTLLVHDYHHNWHLKLNIAKMITASVWKHQIFPLRTVKY